MTRRRPRCASAAPRSRASSSGPTNARRGWSAASASSNSNEQRLTRREAELETLRQTVEDERALITKELERVAALSEQEARVEVMRSVEGELVPEIAERIRHAETQVREEAAERSREILIAAMQRQASEQSGEASVTVVHLPSDELKGRIIGREGRNIRALEAATGVDVIVDDTPEAIVLSSFDPVRREVARATLERLFSDGRIHPARIEEMVVKARNELAQQIKHEGEQACQDIGLTNVHPSLPGCSARSAIATPTATTCCRTARTPPRSPG